MMLPNPAECACCDTPFVIDESVFLYEEHTAEGWVARMPFCLGCGLVMTLPPATRLQACVYAFESEVVTGAHLSHP